MTNKINKYESPGVYPNVDFDAYRKINAVNNSTLGRFKYSPLAARFPGEISEEASKIGQAVHLALEPEKIEDCIVLKPKGLRKGSKAYEEFYDSLQVDQIDLTQASYDSVLGMLRALLADEDIRALIDSCSETELTLVTKDTFFGSGLLKKCRLDGYDKSTGSVIDIKTTQDVSPGAFQGSYLKYGYYRQAAYYSAMLREVGLPFNKFVFCCVSKSGPHFTAIYDVSHDDLSLANKEIKNLLHDYKKCLKTDVWPGFGRGVIGLPDWKVKQLQEMEEVF